MQFIIDNLSDSIKTQTKYNLINMIQMNYLSKEDVFPASHYLD